MDEVLNIYKPLGRTSFSVVAEVRRKKQVKKVGHAGTLDPLADGVLIVLTGKMTKQQDAFMHQDKEYIAKVAFGFSTKTYDLEGEIVNQLPYLSDKKEMDELFHKIQGLLPEVLKSFEGQIMQQVPAYSAVKISGQRLYDLARKNKADQVELPVKKVTIRSIEVLAYQQELIEKIGHKLPVATLKVNCSSGTYIRSLAYDIGNKLNVPSVLAALTRTKVGEFTIENSIKL